MSINKKIHLREGERIIEMVRRYSLTYFWQYLVGLLFLLVFSFFMFQLFTYGIWGYTFYGLGMLVGVYILFRTWFFNHLTFLVISSERVIDIHRLGWFDEIASSVSYKDIDDVAVRKKGFLSNVFNYGSLIIQTKNQKFALEILKINNPHEIQALLTETGDHYQQNRKVLNTKTIYRNFLRIIPDLPDEDLRTTRKLIDEQFEVEEEIDIDE